MIALFKEISYNTFKQFFKDYNLTFKNKYHVTHTDKDQLRTTR